MIQMKQRYNLLFQPNISHTRNALTISFNRNPLTARTSRMIFLISPFYVLFVVSRGQRKTQIPKGSDPRRETRYR